MIDVVTNEMKDGTLQEILHFDDCIYMTVYCMHMYILYAETMAEVHKTFSAWKSAFESEDLKVNLVKTKVMVSKIGQVTVSHLARKTQLAFVVEKQWLIQYYVNLVETVFMEHV